MVRISYLFMALISCVLLFIACDTQSLGSGISNKDKKNATQLVEVFDACYFNEGSVEGVTNDYWMSFVTTGVDEDGDKLKGTGEFVTLEFFPATIENGFPVGSYSFAEEPQDDCALAGWVYEETWAQGSYVYVVEDGVVVDVKFIVSGTMTILGTTSAAEVFVDATFEDGTKGTYYYAGGLKFDNYDTEAGGEGEYNFDFEPIQADEFDVTFDVCQILNNGNLYNTGSDYLELFLNGVEWMACFDLFAPLNSGADVYGTYNIVVDKYDEWCGVPSSGGNEYGDTPSFLGTSFTEDGYYTVAYYVASGRVVIAKDGVDFDITTYKGSKIKGSYDGDVVAETGEPQMVRSFNFGDRKAASFKLVKVSAEDMVYVGALKNRMRK